MNDTGKSQKTAQKANKEGEKKKNLISEEIQRIQELEAEVSKNMEAITELEQKLDETKERELRATADVQNIRRRVQEERGQLLFEGAKNVLETILPALDNFELAMQNLPADLQDNDWVKGILAIEKQMLEALKGQNLELINEMGVELDPSRHEAVMTDPEGEQGKVSKILQKGYLYNGKVLRVAKVAVGAKQ